MINRNKFVGMFIFVWSAMVEKSMCSYDGSHKLSYCFLVGGELRKIREGLGFPFLR